MPQRSVSRDLDERVEDEIHDGFLACHDQNAVPLRPKVIPHIDL
jgi:hypothetical protein